MCLWPSLPGWQWSRGPYYSPCDTTLGHSFNFPYVGHHCGRARGAVR